MITLADEIAVIGFTKTKFVKKKVIELIKKEKFSLIKVFGVFEAVAPNNLYEIIRLSEFKKVPYKGSQYKLIGLAMTKTEAMILVSRLWLGNLES